MRHLRSARKLRRAMGRLGALATFTLLVASGCQVITGTYTVGSGAEKTLGPVCTQLAACCPTVPANDLMTCLEAANEEDEVVCASVHAAYCSGVIIPDGGMLAPDAPMHVDSGVPPLDGSPPSNDAVVHEDVVGPKDVAVPIDTGKDASSPGLEGTWTLQSVTCAGQALTTSGTTTLTFTSGSFETVSSSTDGCVETSTFSPDTITSTDITASSSDDQCGTGCTTADACASGAGGAIDLPYTLSDGTLSISEMDTTDCESGTILFNFTMD